MINFNHIKDLTINGQLVTQLQVGSNIIWKKNVEPTDEWEEYKISQVGWTVDLNNQWQVATVRQDADTNFQTYQSFSNKGVASSKADMKVTIAAGISQFTVHYGSYAESNYDFTLLGHLDIDMSGVSTGTTGTSATPSSTAWRASSVGKESASAPNLIETYTITDTSREHFIWIRYRKDASANSNDDRGYVSFDKRLVSEFDGWRKKEKTYSSEETSPYVYEFYLGERWVYSEDKQTIVKEDPITATTQQLPTQLVDGEVTDTFVYGRYVYYKKYYQVNLNGVWVDTNLFTFGDVARELQIIELEYVASQSTATTPVFDIEYKYGMDYTFEMECIETSLESTERKLLDSPSTTERNSPFEFCFYQYGRYLDYHSPISSSSNLCTNGDYDNRQMITGSTYRVSGETNLQTYQLKVSNTTLTNKLLVNGSQKYNSATTISSTSGKWFDGNYKNRLKLWPNKYFKSFKVYDNNSTLVNNYVFVLKEDDNKICLFDKVSGNFVYNQTANSTYSYIFKSTPVVNVEYQMSDLVYTPTVDGLTTSSTINFTGTTITTYENGFVDTTNTPSSQTTTYQMNLGTDPITMNKIVTWKGITKYYSITQNPFDISTAKVIAYDNNDNVIWATTATSNISLPSSLRSSTYKITFNGSAFSLANSAFTKTNITELTTPYGSYLGSDAFQGCTNLQTLIIGSNNIISRGVFSGCNKLTSVVIGTNTKINDYGVFYSCSSLTSVTFGRNIEITATSELFGTGCTSLNTIYCDSYFPPTIKNSTFQNIKPNGVLHIPQGSTEMYATMMSSNNYYLGLYNWTVIDDIEYNPYKIILHYDVTSTTTATKICDKSSVVSDNTCWINDETTPKKLTSTGYTFTELGDNIITIDTYDRYTSGSNFRRCTNLTSVEFTNGFVNLGGYDFQECTNLTSVTIPDSVTNISLWEFDNCTNLTSIIYSGTIEQFRNITKGNQWRYNVPSTCVVHCTDGDAPISQF